MYSNKPAVRGIMTLSLRFHLMSSEIVIRIDIKKTWTMCSFVNISMMMEVVRKNANEPSSDFENNFVLPNFKPIIAAIESEKLKIKSEMMAILTLKIKTVNIIPVNTQVAPVGE
ncbi:MAG: hypothetical protein VX820_04405 [Candidatus Neomarinimicrobiota bacterium]|nr:hypothetical protein [Candidatus Neomarinimicrobiota bacterium]|tara:strand:+ start:775 stop:1116 length:342 start_codon:yes stop_codon:yes gene_type:complete